LRDDFLVKAMKGREYAEHDCAQTGPIVILRSVVFNIHEGPKAD
jgi:hypothetical protein